MGLGEECRKFLILSVLTNKLGFPGSSGFCLYEHLLFPFSVQGVGLMVTVTQQSSSLGHRFRPKTQKSIFSLHWKHSCLTVLPQVASKKNHLLCFKRPSIAWLKTTFKFPKEWGGENPRKLENKVFCSKNSFQIIRIIYFPIYFFSGKITLYFKNQFEKISLVLWCEGVGKHCFPR